MAKAAKKAATSKTAGPVKRVVSAVKRVAAKAAKKVRRKKVPPTALERQAENLGRMAGRAAAVLDKVRAQGVAAVGLKAEKTGRKTAKRPAKR